MTQKLAVIEMHLLSSMKTFSANFFHIWKNLTLITKNMKTFVEEDENFYSTAVIISAFEFLD